MKRSIAIILTTLLPLLPITAGASQPITQQLQRQQEVERLQLQVRQLKEQNHLLQQTASPKQQTKQLQSLETRQRQERIQQQLRQQEQLRRAQSRQLSKPKSPQLPNNKGNNLNQQERLRSLQQFQRESQQQQLNSQIHHNLQH
jgi:hypothetical protein